MKDLFWGAVIAAALALGASFYVAKIDADVEKEMKARVAQEIAYVDEPRTAPVVTFTETQQENFSMTERFINNRIEEGYVLRSSTPSPALRGRYTTLYTVMERKRR